MTTTARKYYFKPDNDSRKSLPELFRINHDGINSLIKKNGDLCSSLRELRLEADSTRAAQLELDEILKMEKEAYDKIRSEDEAELERLSRARYACRDKDKVRHAELHKAYCKLKSEAKKKRRSFMNDFKASVKERRYAAQRIVNEANWSDYRESWGEVFDDFKEGYEEQTGQKQKYHLDNYKRYRLNQAREELEPDQRVDMLKFVRGYGTDLPASGSIVTGHQQSGGGDGKDHPPGKRGKVKPKGKYTTVAEYRQACPGAGSSFIKKLKFPDPSAWDPRLPKGDRKLAQIGEVEFSLLGRKISGTCLFHQALPDDYCITGAALVVSVHSGNTYYYLTLTAKPRSEMGKNTFENLKEFFGELGAANRLSEEEVEAAKKKIRVFKEQLSKKEVDGAFILEVDSKYQELTTRAKELREAKKAKRV